MTRAVEIAIALMPQHTAGNGIELCAGSAVGEHEVLQPQMAFEH